MYEHEFKESGGVMARKFSLKELEGKPTLCTGQADDLKFDDGKTRVWLSRCTTADGEPYDNHVSVEKLIDGKWVLVDEYPAEE